MMGTATVKLLFKCFNNFDLVRSVSEQSDGSVPVKYSESNDGKKKYPYDVDLTKPIVCQVGYLGADYDEWVHVPIISHDTSRFFKSDFCEDRTSARDSISYCTSRLQISRTVCKSDQRFQGKPS